MTSQSPTFSEIPQYKAARGPRVEALEIALAIAIVTCLLPDTSVTYNIGLVFWWVLNNLGVSQQMGGWVFYAVGWLLSFCLLLVYVRERKPIYSKSPIVSRLADAVCVFTAICMLDIVLSTANSYSPENRSWVFFALSPFLLCLLYLNSNQCMRLVRFLAICTCIQACYAICFYLTSKNQFYTPHFGNRTSGTFINPNGLYPICLIGLPLCVAICQAESVRLYKFLFGIAAAANVLALLFTYTRTAWIGIAIAALTALWLPGSLWRRNKYHAKFVAVCAVIGTLGALFIRTNGSIAANPNDRSTRGRFQIWNVSLLVITHHPWLGSGLSTYRQKQDELMTPALEQYNPMNDEAKSLYLNVWAEMGLIGLAVLALVGFRYAKFYGSSSRAAPEANDEATAVLFASAVSTIAIAIAGLADTPILQFDRVPDTFGLMVLLGASVSIGLDTVRTKDDVIKPRSQRLRRASQVLVGALGLFCLWTSASTLVLIHSAEPVMDHFVKEMIGLPLYANNHQTTGEIIDPLIAAEDKNFYTHHGVDWEAARWALSKDIRSLSFSHGGSTITMQAVRYIMLPYDKTPARKIAQIILALQLERRLSKQQILRLYLDSVSFGLQTAGLESAAKIYFDKRPEKLTLAESAFLAGAISHPPASQEQVTQQFVRDRMEPVLAHIEQLYGDKYSAEELDRAREEDLHFSWEH